MLPLGCGDLLARFEFAHNTRYRALQRLRHTAVRWGLRPAILIGAPAERADVTAQLVMSAQVITGDVRVRNFGYLSSNSVLVDVFFLSVVDANERLD